MKPPLISILSCNLFATLSRDYKRKYGIKLHLICPDGSLVSPEKNDPLSRCPLIQRARENALSESVRWGEPYIFFLAPGIVSWIVPVVNQSTVLGGIIGGEVLGEDEQGEMRASLIFLAEAGVKRSDAGGYLKSLAHWPQCRTREAADYLFSTLYQMAPYSPWLLTHNRDSACQQRQIAEAIHEGKRSSTSGYSFHEEQQLLSLIRVGDRSGSRALLNKLLANIFLRSPKLAVVKARMIELLGYLIRAAIEDNPMLEPLLGDNLSWIEKILAADDFEGLCQTLCESLDDFMNRIYLQGHNRTSCTAQKILDYINNHYTQKIALDDVAAAVGLSRFRVAHLIKEVTGKTIVQHIRQLRIQRAVQLLETSDMDYADIAYELGFSDQSYFIKQFRERTGTTPAKYRKRR